MRVMGRIWKIVDELFFRSFYVFVVYKKFLEKKVIIVYFFKVLWMVECMGGE